MKKLKEFFLLHLRECSEILMILILGLMVLLFS